MQCNTGAFMSKAGSEPTSSKSDANSSSYESDTSDPHSFTSDSDGSEYNHYTSVVRHAKYMGIDPEIDSDYLWIAEEAILAPVPKGWTTNEGEGEYDGLIYYSNDITNEAIWDHPLHDHYLRLFENHKKLGTGKKKCNIFPNRPNICKSAEIGEENDNNDKKLIKNTVNEYDDWDEPSPRMVQYPEQNATLSLEDSISCKISEVSQSLQGQLERMPLHLSNSKEKSVLAERDIFLSKIQNLESCFEREQSKCLKQDIEASELRKLLKLKDTGLVELECTAQGLRRELSLREDEIEVLAKELKTLRIKHSDMSNKLSTLENETSKNLQIYEKDIKLELNQLKEKYADAVKELVALNEQVIEQNQRITDGDNMLLKYNEMEEEFGNIKKAHSIANDKIFELHEQCKDRSKISADYSQMKIEFEVLQQKNTDFSNQMKLIHENEQRMLEFEKLKLNLAKTTLKLEESNNEVMLQRASIEESRRSKVELDTIKEEKAVQEHELINLKKEAEQYKFSLASSYKKIQALEEELEAEKVRHNSQCQHLNHKFSQLESVNIAIKNEFAAIDDAANKRIKEMQLKYDASLSDLSEKETKIAAFEDQQQEEKNKMKKSEQKLVKMQNSLLALQAKIENQSKANKSLEAILDDTKKELEASRETIENNRREFTSNFDRIQLQVSTKVPEIAEMAVKNHEKKWKLTMDTKIDSLRKDYESQIAQYSDELVSLKSKLVESEAQRLTERTNERFSTLSLQSKIDQLEKEILKYKEMNQLPNSNLVGKQGNGKYCNSWMAEKHDHAMSELLNQISTVRDQTRSFMEENMSSSATFNTAVMTPLGKDVPSFKSRYSPLFPHSLAFTPLNHNNETPEFGKGPPKTPFRCSVEKISPSANYFNSNSGINNNAHRYSSTHDETKREKCDDNDSDDELHRQIGRLLQKSPNRTEFGVREEKSEYLKVSASDFNVVSRALAAISINPEEVGKSKYSSSAATTKSCARSLLLKHEKESRRNNLFIVDISAIENVGTGDFIDTSDGGFHVGYWNQKYGRTSTIV